MHAVQTWWLVNVEAEVKGSSRFVGKTTLSIDTKVCYNFLCTFVATMNKEWVELVCCTLLLSKLCE